MFYRVYVITRTSERDYVRDEYETVVRYIKVAECAEHYMCAAVVAAIKAEHPEAEIEVENG